MCKAEIESTYEGRSEELGCPNPEFSGVARGRAHLQGDRSPAGQLGEISGSRLREQRILAPAPQRPNRPPAERRQHGERYAEREDVDGDDPDPPERNAEAVQGTVSVLRRGLLRRGLQVESDRREVRGADRRRLAALQPLDARRQPVDPRLDLVCLFGLPECRELRLQPGDRAVGRVQPASRSWMSTCSLVIVPSLDRRVIAACTLLRGIFSVRSADAALA